MAVSKNPFLFRSFFRSIQLIQVFDSVPGRMICRFFISSSAPEMGKHLSFKTLEGEPLEAEPIVLDAFYERRGFKTQGFSVISVELPRMRPFVVTSRGGAAFTVTQEMLEKKAHQRDCMMVNPSIDGLYQKWMDQIEPPAGYSREWVSNLAKTPLFSIITPLFNTPESFLREMIESVLAQTYERWELVLVNASPENARMDSILGEYDDPRIRVITLEENKGIAANTNVGIREAKGEFVCFLDHDDTLAPDILAEYARVANKDPEVDLMYCDEDSLSEGGTERFDPRFKPDLNRGLLWSIDYFLHLLCVSRRVIEAIDLSPDEMSGAQDYDLSFKASEVARSIRHIPRIGYHWRDHDGSSRGGRIDCGKPYLTEAGMRAIRSHFARCGINADVEPSRYLGAFNISPRFDPSLEAALVAIPGRAGTLANLIDSYQSCAMHEDMTVYYVDSKPQPIAALDADIRTISVNKHSSFATRVNAGVRAARGDVIILASTDIRFMEEHDLELLCAGAIMPGIGTVAPRAVFADGLLQHAGLCIHEDASIGYLNQNFTTDMGGGYHGTAEFTCDFSALDPQCIAFRKSVFEEVGGFDEAYDNPVVAGVDFCIRLRQAGYRILGLPAVKVTSFAPFVDNQLRRGLIKGDDMQRLWQVWPEEYRHDVLANPSVDMSDSYFHLNVKGIH